MIKWKKTKDELPPLNKSTRCLARIDTYKPKSTSCWEGLVDVYFDPHIGWRRCETEDQVWVEEWIEIDEIIGKVME